jgi:UDP-glucose 4-epimerase
LAGQGAAINGDGEQTRDFVEVSDVVRALLAASESRECGACNIGTGLETSINDLVAAIGDLVDHDLEVSHAPARDGEVRRSVLDPTLAAQTFGWKAEVPLEQGLRRTLDHFR